MLLSKHLYCHGDNNKFETQKNSAIKIIKIINNIIITPILYALYCIY